MSNLQVVFVRGALVRAGVSAMALACALGAGSALAQPAQAGASSDDIIVTAQRRSERLEAVPMSVTAVSPERIAAAGVSNVRDLSGVVPGFQLAASGTFPQPAIRGVSSTVSQFFDNNVAVYVDGLYQSAPLILNLDLPNVSSVEVLKGPQGTLYGRNATGGAVLINTLDPSNQLHAKAEFGYGRFNDWRGSGYISGPLDEKVSVSLAGAIRRSDGYNKLGSRTVAGATDGNASPIKQQSIRAKVKFDFSSSFSALVWVANTYISDTSTNVYTPVENVSPTIATNASYVAGTVPKKVGIYAYDPENVGASKQTEFGLKLKLKTGIGTIQSITGYTDTTTYSKLDFDGTYTPNTYLDQKVKNYTFQQTVDYNIDAIKGLNLIIGGTYVDAILRGDSDTYVASPAGAVKTGATPLSLTTDYVKAVVGNWHNPRKSWAAYVDATWNPIEHVYINVGGRYTRETLGADVFASNRTLVNTSATFKKFTPRASIRYEFDPRTSVYATYSQGFRGGNYGTTLPACVVVTLANPVACAFNPGKQEGIEAYEVGFKTARPGFRFDIAGFYYNYSDLLITSVQTDPVTKAPVSNLFNAPKAKIYGAEANVMWQPVQNLTLTAGATWLHARYGDGFFFSGIGVNPAVAGLNTNADVLRTYGNVTQIQDLSGKTMTRSPSFSGNIGLTYKIPQGEGGWELSANARFTTKYIPNNPSVWGTAAGVPAARQGEQRFTQDGYAIVNASITWTHPSGNYYARFWGKNLGDKQFILNMNNAVYGTYIEPSEPLSFGGTIGFKM